MVMRAPDARPALKRSWPGRIASRVRRRFTARAAILMYHRVADVTADPQLLAVAPGHFAEHLEVIRAHYRPMRLGELVTALVRDRVPRRAVVVTMDDGYADNLYNARPLLERHGVPATIFVSSGYVADGGEFWWDELERLVLRPGVLPATLRFTAGGRSYRYEVEAIRYGDDDHDRHRAWHVERRDDPTSRHRLYRRLYDDLYALTAAERAGALEELRSCIVTSPNAGFARALTSGELVDLAASPLVDIGAHTVTHAVLPQLSASAQWHEIHQSREQLERLLDRPVTSFAYPHGGVTPDAVRMVAQAGFTCAGASEAGTVTPHSDRYRLPRVLVRDLDGDGLRRRLHGWLDA